MTIPELRAALEKRRDKKAAENGYTGDNLFLVPFWNGQDDLIPIILKLTEALEGQMAELDSYGSRKPGQDALEELEA